MACPFSERGFVWKDETEKENKFEKRAAISSNAAPRCDIYDYFCYVPMVGMKIAFQKFIPAKDFW